MSYKERKPIYQAYEEIVGGILKRHMHIEYAVSEIDSLDRDLFSQFKMIREKLIANKNEINKSSDS